MLRRLRQPENIALIIALAALVIAPVFCHFSMRLDPPLYELPEAEFTFQPPLIFPEVLSASLVITAITFIICLITFGCTVHPKAEPVFSPLLAGILCFVVVFALFPCAYLFPRLLDWFILFLVLFGLALALYVASQLSRYSRWGLSLTLALFAGLLLTMSTVVNLYDGPDLKHHIPLDDQAYWLLRVNYEFTDSQPDSVYALVRCDPFGWSCHSLWSSAVECISVDRCSTNEPHSVQIQLAPKENKLLLQVDDRELEFPLEPPA